MKTVSILPVSIAIFIIIENVYARYLLVEVDQKEEIVDKSVDVGTKDNKSICELKIDPGTGWAQVEVYGFDKNTGNCKLFHYGGFEGNENRFNSKQECEKTCKALEKYQQRNNGCEGKKCGDVCIIGRMKGMCSEDKKCVSAKDAVCEKPCRGSPMQGYCETFPKKGYTFDPESKTCKKFFESGCGMTKNAFLKKEECEAKCETKTVKRIACPNNGVCGPMNYMCCHGECRPFYSVLCRL